MFRSRKDSRSSSILEKSKPFVFPKGSAPPNLEADLLGDDRDYPDLISIKITAERLCELCNTKGRYLAHLCREKNEKYFLQNVEELPVFGFWVLKALPGHGVAAGIYSRPTINFFLLNEEFARGYEDTAQIKKIKHGVVFERSAIEQLAEESGYDFATVQVRHPNADNICDPTEYWRYDIGCYRFSGMHKLNYATVERLATPLGEEEQLVFVPGRAIVGWW